MILRLYPDNRPLSGDSKSAELGVLDITAALHTLRVAYNDHRSISTISCITVEAAPGAEYAVVPVEEKLASFIHDIGNSVLDCWHGAVNVIRNMPHIENEPKNDAITNIYNGTVLCIASGPSAQKWFARIREIQDRVCIVCTDSILVGLLEAGIEPHFVCILERDEIISTLFDATGSKVTLIAPALVHPASIEKWKGRRVWWWQRFNDLYSWLGKDIQQWGSGRSAGMLAAAASLVLGASKIYLIGHDLCRSDTGKTHAKSAHPLSKSSHSTSVSDKAPFHQDILDESGKTTCLFWQLCRGDLTLLDEENPGLFKILGRDGLDIGAIEREQGIEISNPLSFVLPEMKVSQSLSPINDIGKIIAGDLVRWNERSDEVGSLSRIRTPEAIAKASELVHPKTWGDPGLTGMYMYVMGPIFRAASLRAHLRMNTPTAHADGFRILLRTIPAMLSRMVREAP